MRLWPVVRHEANMSAFELLERLSWFAVANWRLSIEANLPMANPWVEGSSAVALISGDFASL